jgi:hypothetical protein
MARKRRSGAWRVRDRADAVVECHVGGHVVKRDHARDRRGEIWRADHDPGRAHLDSASRFQRHRRGHGPVGNIVVPSIVVGVVRDRLSGIGGRRDAEAAEHQQVALRVHAEISKGDLLTPEAAAVEARLLKRTSDAARARVDDQRCPVFDVLVAPILALAPLAYRLVLAGLADEPVAFRLAVDEVDRPGDLRVPERQLTERLPGLIVGIDPEAGGLALDARRHAGLAVAVVLVTADRRAADTGDLGSDEVVFWAVADPGDADSGMNLAVGDALEHFLRH